MKKGDYSTIEKAKKYHKERFSGHLKIINRDEIHAIHALITKYLHIQSPIITDIGAGTGRITKELITFNPKKLYTLDQSSAMLHLLIRNLPGEYKSGILKIIVSNSDDIPLSSNSSDIAVSMHLFKHIANLKPTIGEVSRILKKNGLFLFDFLNSKSLIKLRPTSCFVYSIKYIKELLRDAGFIMIDHLYIHSFGETIYQFIGQKYINFFHEIDTKISGKLHTGTKIIILARKI